MISRQWSSGDVIKAMFPLPLDLAACRATFINARRDKFKDPQGP